MTEADKKKIEQLCREHTALSAEDVASIHEVAVTLHTVADLMNADVFIDCKTHDKDVAIVVAQARPSSGKTLYQHSVVGEFAQRINEPAALRTLDVGMPTQDMLAKTQENRDVRQNVSPIKNGQGEVVACLIAETDVTKAVQTKQHISVLSKTTEQLAETLMSMLSREQGIPYHVTDGIILFNQDGLCVFTNPVAQAIYKKLGYMNLLEGLHFSDLALENIFFEDIVEQKQVVSPGIKVAGLVLNVKYTPMYSSATSLPTGVVMLMTDETAVMEKEKELILKSVALQEIHHRVKNNLQTIASLLRLQSRRINDAMAKQAFNKSISRVLSIAATHEILAQNGMDDVDLLEMIKRILTSVTQHSLSANRDIRIRVLGDVIKTNSDIATSIGLVVNEIIQNSLKYAFEGREKGLITVEIRKGKTCSNISITDDGIGYNEKTINNGNSLGSTIVQQLVTDKLGGTLHVDSGPKGTSVFFDFITNKIYANSQ
nr:sensor histidine kinase [uncultured Desulfobulbus sp.]